MEDFEKGIRVQNIARQVGLINKFGDMEISDPEFSKGHPTGYVNKYGKMKMGDGTWKYVGTGKSSSPAPAATPESRPTPKPSAPARATSGKPSMDDYDLDEVAKVLTKRKADIDNAIDKYNVGKTGDAKLWSHQTNKPEVKEIRAKAIKDNPSKAVDAQVEFQKAGGTDHIILKFPQADAASYESNVTAARKSLSDKMKKVVGMVNTSQSKALLSKIDSAVKKLRESSDNTYASIEHLSAHSSDGKSGMFDIKMSFGNEASASLKIMTTPGGAQIMNMKELQDQIGYSSFTNSNKRAFSQMIDAVGSAVGSGGSDVISFTAETRAKAQSLISNKPANTRYTTWQGSRVDNEAGTVELFVNTDRAARHPDEYGAEGDRAEMIAHKYSSELDKNVVRPLEKMGYSVSISAK